MSTHAANMGLQPPEDLNVVCTHVLCSRHLCSPTSPDFPLLDLTLAQLNRGEYPDTCPQIITRGPTLAVEVSRPCRKDKVRYPCRVTCLDAAD